MDRQEVFNNILSNLEYDNINYDVVSQYFHIDYHFFLVCKNLKYLYGNNSSKILKQLQNNILIVSSFILHSNYNYIITIFTMYK